MGFKHWVQGLEIIGMFLVVVAIPCFFIAFWGCKMVNDIGNKPSQNAKIQAGAGWKIFLVEIVAFTMLVGLFIFLYNLQNI